MTLQEIYTKFDDFIEGIKAVNNDSNEFFQLMLGFRKFISTVKDNSICTHFFESPKFEEYKIFFQKNNEYYMKGIELLEVTKILEGKITDIEQDHIRYGYQEKHQEINMFNLSKVKSIAVVGSGSFSETMLYCHQQTKIEKIIGIDNSSTAIKYSSKLAKYMNMERLEFVHKNAQEYNFRDVDIIYIAGFSYPKNAILDQIYATARSNTQILVDDCSQYLQRVIYNQFKIDESQFNTIDINYLNTPYCHKKVILLSMDK